MKNQKTRITVAVIVLIILVLVQYALEASGGGVTAPCPGCSITFIQTILTGV